MRKALILGVFAVALVAPSAASAHPRAPFHVVGQDPGLAYYAVHAGDRATLAGQYGEVDRIPTKVTLRVAGRAEILGEADVGADGSWTLPVEVPSFLESLKEYKVVQEPNVDIGGYELESILFGVDKPVLVRPTEHTSQPSSQAPVLEVHQESPANVQTPADPADSRAPGVRSLATGGRAQAPSTRTLRRPAAPETEGSRARELSASPEARRPTADTGAAPAQLAHGSADLAARAKVAPPARTDGALTDPARRPSGGPRPSVHPQSGSPAASDGAETGTSPERSASSSGDVSVGLVLGVLFLMAAASATAIMLLRRPPATPDTVQVTPPEPAPPVPDAVEAELQEMIAEEHARKRALVESL